MKTQVLFFLAGLLLIACGSKTTENTATVDSLTVAPDDHSTLEKLFPIKGKDIWVRDKPGTGQVVMTLNDGDPCKILGTGEQFEIIRGQADYWFKIEFNGKQGWVFGAQLDHNSGKQPLVGSSIDELWITFKEGHRSDCETWNARFKAENPSADESYNFIESGGNADNPFAFDITPPNEFGVEFSGMGSDFTKFSKGTSSTEGIVLFNEQRKFDGAAGIGNSASNYVGLKKNNQYQMYTDLKLDGAFDRLNKLNNREYVLVTFSDTGPGIAMYRTTYYNLYYVNVEDITARKIASQMGTVETGMHEQSLPVGDLNVTSASLDFNEDASGLALTEYRSKKITEEMDSFMPYDTIITHYNWESKTKTFVKQ